MNDDLKNKTFSNFIWRFAERCGAQIVQFVVSIILARILTPNDYGVVAIVLVFTQILQVFVDSGLGNALIQKKDADELDFSSVFYFNIVWCLILYAIAYMTAPFISGFYDNGSMTPIIRTLCVIVIISGIKNVQQAYVSRTLQFKKFFYATVAGMIVSGGVAIAFAFLDYGVWALVIQRILSLLMDTVILWVTVKWRPILAFSFNRLKGLLSFGWKLLVAALMDKIYENLRQIVVGKLYSESDLAYYNQGTQFPNLIVTNINTSIDSVLLPVMAGVQDDPKRVKTMVRRSIKTSTYIMAPLMMGLFFCADNVVKLILTDKWLPCVPFLRIFCITYMFQPIHTANLNAIKALGRSDLFLKMEVAKKIIGIILLLATMRISVMALAYSMLIGSVSSQIINSFPNWKLLNYSYLEQLKDISPGIIFSVIMGGIVYMIGKVSLPVIPLLTLQIIAGALIYIGLSWIFKLESFMYCKSIVMPHLYKLIHKVSSRGK